MVSQEQQLELGGGVLACWWVTVGNLGGHLLLRRQRARASAYTFTHVPRDPPKAAHLLACEQAGRHESYLFYGSHMHGDV